MTVSSSTTFEFDVNDIVLQAYRLAGLLSIQESLSGIDATFGSHGRKTLERIVDHLATYGINANAVDLTTLSLTAGTNSYELSSSYLDVIDTATYIDASDTADDAEGETIIKPIPRDEWVQLPNKSAEGKPTLYYVHRAGTLTVYFWPTPNEAGTVRLQVHRLLADVQDGNATVDLQRYWADYLIWELAHQLSMGSSVSMQRTLYLGKWATTKLKKCRSYARQRTAARVGVRHPTPWSR